MPREAGLLGPMQTLVNRQSLERTWPSASVVICCNRGQIVGCSLHAYGNQIGKKRGNGGVFGLTDISFLLLFGGVMVCVAVSLAVTFMH